MFIFSSHGGLVAIPLNKTTDIYTLSLCHLHSGETQGVVSCDLLVLAVDALG